MNTSISPRALIAAGILSLSSSLWAHVPYIEKTDYTSSTPFVLEDVENSKSIHGALMESDDVDIVSITIEEPARIYTSTNIPFCPQYESFAVTYALTGPGLPAPESNLPVTLPDGHGAIVVRTEFESVDDRPVFYEPFGGRLMWEGPDFAIDQAPAGEYRMIIWNESGASGNYIAVVGQKEIFGPAEIAQARRVSPQLRNGKNLLVECNPQADAQADARRVSDNSL
jgi:hypothetical protein